MSGQELLRSVVAALEAAGIPFMLTGSFAAAYHGAARATMDIDLVIEPTGDRLAHLVELLGAPGVYVSADAALEALARESMFNVVDATTGWKADLIVRKSRPFSRTEFARRRRVEVEGVPLWIATVEDTILAKLEWAKLGGSARQLEDVAALLRVQAGELDRGYLETWIAELGLGAQWQAAERAVGDR